MTGPPKITCPVCGRSSTHPGDIKNRYCGYCHRFHADMKIGEEETGTTKD